MSTLSSSISLIYLNPFIQRISLEVYLGNSQILPANVDFELTAREPAYFVDYFQKLNARRRGDLIDLVVLEQLGMDIILGHDKSDSSAMPLQAIVIFANFKNITFNLQLGIVTELTTIANNISSIKDLTAIAEARPPVRMWTRYSMEAFGKQKGLSADQMMAMKVLNKEIIRELFAIPIWQDIYSRYKMIDSLDVKRRIEFKYKLQSMVYQVLKGKTYDDLKREYDKFLEDEKKYLQRKEEIANALKMQETSGAPFLSAQAGEGPRQRVSRLFTRLSKQSWKYHVHFRMHSNLYLNFLDEHLKKDFSVIINGLDLNIVKPRGRFHTNIGLMLKNFLVMMNLKDQQKVGIRSVYDNGRTVPRLSEGDRDSLRASMPSHQSE